LTTKRTSATTGGMRCGAFTLVGPLQGDGDRFGYRNHRCRSYRCSFCGPRKLRQIRRGIAAVAQERQLTRLATLTLDPSKIVSAESSIEYIRETWRKMRVSLQRFLGKPIEFIAVLELQRTGVAHLHVLVGTYLPQDWLSKAWQGVGGGKIVDIRWVDVHRISAYLSKYLTSRTLTELPAGTRRFSCSRGIVLWARKQHRSGWWICALPIEKLRGLARDVTDERWDAEVLGLDTLEFFAAEFLRESALSGIRWHRRLVIARGDNSDRAF
jgi:hypothetical protein